MYNSSYLGCEVSKNQPAACSPWAVSTPCWTYNTNSATKHLITVWRTYYKKKTYLESQHTSKRNCYHKQILQQFICILIYCLLWNERLPKENLLLLHLGDLWHFSHSHNNSGMQVRHCNKLHLQVTLKLLWKKHFKSNSDVQAQIAGCY